LTQAGRGEAEFLCKGHVVEGEEVEEAEVEDEAVAWVEELHEAGFE
jgi:hypothetical protein